MIKFKTTASTKLLLIFIIAAFAPSQVTANLIKLDTEVAFNSVYLLEDPDAAVTTVALTVLAGEVDVDGPEGLSHYLEHLMYWHADNVDDRPIHTRSGNAWVNGIVTSYYNQSERSDLNDMFEFVKRLFAPPELDKGFMVRERSVVAREYDLSVSESPVRRIRTAIQRDLYDDLPVSRSVIGNLKSIHSLTLEQATDFHKRFYHPSNSVLFIAGKFGKQEAEQLVNARFADLKPGIRHSAAWRNARITATADNVELFTDSQINHDELIYLSLSEWPNTQSSVENWYTLWVLRSVLDSALEGGIAKPLRMDNFVLRTFDIGLSSYLADYFELSLFAEPDQGVSLEQASTEIADTLGDLAKKGIPEDTLERVRDRLLQSENRRSDRTGSHYDRMSQQLSAGLNPVTFRQHLEHIEKVSLNDVNEMLNALANPKRRSVAHISPNGE